MSAARARARAAARETYFYPSEYGLDVFVTAHLALSMVSDADTLRDLHGDVGRALLSDGAPHLRRVEPSSDAIFVRRAHYVATEAADDSGSGSGGGGEAASTGAPQRRLEWTALARGATPVEVTFVVAAPLSSAPPRAVLRDGAPIKTWAVVPDGDDAVAADGASAVLITAEVGRSDTQFEVQF